MAVIQDTSAPFKPGKVLVINTQSRTILAVCDTPQEATTFSENVVLDNLRQNAATSLAIVEVMAVVRPTIGIEVDTALTPMAEEIKKRKEQSDDFIPFY